MKHLLLFIILIALFSITHTPPSTAQSDRPLADYPVITAENVAQLEQLKVFGEGLVRDVIFSPDEQYLAMSTSIGIWLYSVDDLTTPIRLFGNYEIDVNIAIFNADETRLFGGLHDGSVYVWDVASGELVITLSESTNQKSSVKYLYLSDDEQKLYILTGYQLIIWNLIEVKEEARMNIGWNSALSPDKNYVLSHRIIYPRLDENRNPITFTSSETIVYDVSTGLPLYQLETEYESLIYNPQFDPTGTKIIAILGYANGAIGIWDTQSGELLYIVGDEGQGYKYDNTYAKPYHQTTGLDGALLSKDHSKAIFFYDNYISVWDVATNQALNQFSFTINRNVTDENLFTPYETISFLDSTNQVELMKFIEDEDLLHHIPFYIEFKIIDISPKHTYFFTQRLISDFMRDFYPFHIWRVSDGVLIQKIDQNKLCNGWAYNSGFTWLSFNNKSIVYYYQDVVCVWDVETEKLIIRAETDR